MIQIQIPRLVVGKAKALGEKGECWLNNLSSIILELEEMWNVKVKEVIDGGSHALVCVVDDEDKVLKIEIPDVSEDEFMMSVRALRMAKGNGYVKLYAYHKEYRALLLERLGQTLNSMNYSVEKQIEILCNALKQTWQMPVTETLKNGVESLYWFENYIENTNNKLGKPCSVEVIKQVNKFLSNRKNNIKIEDFVLVHGDAHNNNMLQYKDGFKLIDPDGLLFEKAYDLGVLMREWPEYYKKNALQEGKKRAQYLSNITGVSKQDIFEWGYLHMVATALILLDIKQYNLGNFMLEIAHQWIIEEDEENA